MKNRKKVTSDWNKEIHPFHSIAASTMTYKFIQFIPLLRNILIAYLSGSW